MYEEYFAFREYSGIEGRFKVPSPLKKLKKKFGGGREVWTSFSYVVALLFSSILSYYTPSYLYGKCR